MSELLMPLQKDEKQKRKLYKETYGIDTEGPLDPEYVKGRYDIAYGHKQGMDEVADIAEAQSRTNENPAGRESLAKQAEQYRYAGQLALEQTLEDIQKYVKKNSAHYYQQAQEDMAADPTTRAHTESMARTLDEIKDLPETEAPEK